MMNDNCLAELDVVAILRRLDDAGGTFVSPAGHDAEIYEWWGTGFWELDSEDASNGVDPYDAFQVCITGAGKQLLELLDAQKDVD